MSGPPLRAEEAQPGELASGGTHPFRSVSEDKGGGGLTKTLSAHARLLQAASGRLPRYALVDGALVFCTIQHRSGVYGWTPDE